MRLLLAYARWMWAEAVWIAQSVGYWVRPYDMVADRRRWRWQRRARCGSAWWASLPPGTRDALTRAVEAVRDERRE